LECGGLTPLSFFSLFFLPAGWRCARKGKERKRRQAAALQSSATIRVGQKKNRQ
jgi:hypothetical protein